MTSSEAKSPDRLVGLDVGRGALLVAMVAVHIVSAHGAAAQVRGLHGWVGVFLISSGFVGLSGYVIGVRASGSWRRRVVRGLDRGAQLLLVLFAYGALLSLARHGLSLAGGGAQSCSARLGWVPPLRFDDLGILLPIALVQILAPMAGARARRALPILGSLAIVWMLLPAATAGADDPITGILTRRTLTPFYTVSTFVAIGLVGALLGRAGPRLLAPAARSLGGGWPSLIAAIVLSMPPVSQNLLDPVYLAGGEVAGSLTTLVYWSAVLALLLRGFLVPGSRSPGPVHGALALLGRNSLLVFVLHDVLLVIDAFARPQLGLDKGPLVIALLLASNVAVLLAVARAVERSRGACAAADAVLLGRSRPLSLWGGSPLSLPGALALAGVLAVYTSSALARPGAELVVDDFERSGCPGWWTFGFAPQERVAEGSGHALEVRGAAPGSYAHGRGVFLDRDLGSRRTLSMRVRGEGPGSGRVKIELSEDDNGNWEIEKGPPLYVPEHDDRFVHELGVDWRGWRNVELPLSSFRDDNPGKGNDRLDPERDLTSGGLLELQLLFAPSGRFGDDVRIALDDLRFTP